MICLTCGAKGKRFGLGLDGVVTKNKKCKRKGEENTMELTLKALQGLAKQMQEGIGFDPPIDYKSKSMDDLTKSIKINAEDLEEQDEEIFSDQSKKVLSKLGVGPWIEEDEEEEEDDEEVDEEEVKQSDIDEEEEEEEEEVKPKSKKGKTKMKPKAVKKEVKKATKKVKEVKVVKKEVVKGKKVKSLPKKPGAGKTKFGHVVGSMSGTIDEMLIKGVKINEATKTLVKKFDREPEAATKKFKSHIRHLENVKDVAVSFINNIYKVK